MFERTLEGWESEFVFHLRWNGNFVSFFQAVDDNLTEEEKREKEMEGKEGRRCVRSNVICTEKQNKKTPGRAGWAPMRLWSRAVYFYITHTQFLQKLTYRVNRNDPTLTSEQQYKINILMCFFYYFFFVFFLF